jgi:hypothetical protein
MKSPVTLLSYLLDDVARYELDVKGLDRDVQTIESRFKHEGYGFLSITLASLCDAVDNGLSSGSFTCPSAFAKRRGEALPRFLSGLLCKVFDSKTGLLLECPSLNAVKALRETLRLFKKVKLSPKRSEKLEREAIAKFLDTDELIRNHSYDPKREDYLRAACKVILPDLDGFDSRTLLYKHGPGGVAEKFKANYKWVSLLETLKNNGSLAYLLGFDVGTFTGTSIIDYDNQFKGLPLFESSTFHRYTTLQFASEGIAKLITVPKDSQSLRTITAEPVIKQFYQQGLNTYLRDKILRCNVLSNSLALTDQTKNQVLALEGSLNCKYSTLDLSSASDLLSVSLVSIVFGSRPVFLEHMLRSRSPFVDTGNGVYQMAKFAGMGNALTFPVQSVVFATLAICAVMEQDELEASYVNAKRASRKVRVYGDDIIVNSNYSHRVCEWLTSFGLKVNQKKSFLEGNFKESCGVDAYKGVDVTPVYLRHEPFLSARDPEKIASLVSTSNQLWLHGLHKAAEYVRSLVDAVIKLPLVSKHSSSLGWHSRVDTTIAQKWDRKLQRLVFRGQIVEPCYHGDDISDGDAALLKSLTLLNRRDQVLGESGYEPSGRQSEWYVSDPENLQRSVRRFKTRIRARWVPANAG